MANSHTLRLSDILPGGITPDDFYVLLAGLVSGMVVFMVGNALITRDPMTKRVKAIQERRAQLKGEITAPRKRSRREKTGSINIMREVVSRLKLLQASQIGKLQHNLITAGWRGKDTIYVFAFFQLLLPFVFLGIGLVLADIDWQHPLAGKKWKLFVPIVSAYFGLKLPNILLANARGKRYLTIQRGLADALDLMMICAEAGLSLAASLDRVSRELRFAYPILAEELSLTSVELGFLPDRKKALLNLAERVDLQEIRGISNVLIQTEKYGTPISQALRVLAAEFRTQRMLRAEQKAAKLPALMTVPMIVFILPTLFIVILAPAGVKLMDTFANK